MSKHDEKVKSMMELLEKKKSALGKKPAGLLKTNGIFKLNDKEHVNLNVLNDVDTVITCYAHVLSQSFAYLSACTGLGITKEFKYNGYSLEEWGADFKLRFAIIQWNAQQNELNALAKKLDALVSEDLKTERELENIEALLK